MWDVVAQQYRVKTGELHIPQISESSVGIGLQRKGERQFMTMVINMINGKMKEEKVPSSQEIQEHIERRITHIKA
jgi:hypothetical protein